MIKIILRVVKETADSDPTMGKQCKVWPHYGETYVKAGPTMGNRYIYSQRPEMPSGDMSHVSSECIGSGGISRMLCWGQEMAGGYISCVGARKWLEPQKQ